jgi:hypothetical protein
MHRNNMPSTPIPFTSDPMALLAIEAKLFLGLIFDLAKLGILSTIWPFRSKHAEDELSFTRGNLWSLCVHGVLFFLQTLFLLFIVVSPFGGVPAIIWTAVVVVGIQLNRGICNVLLNNYGQRLFYDGGKYSLNEQDAEMRLIPSKPGSYGERWVFINGVSVG